MSARAEGYYSVYYLETNALEGMAKTLLAEETLPEVAKDLDRKAYDRKVLKTYLDSDARIAQLPTNHRKLAVVLRYLAEQFETDRKYSEKEVNEIISSLNEDVSGLRRDLISYHYLDRKPDGSAYWRVDGVD